MATTNSGSFDKLHVENGESVASRRRCVSAGHRRTLVP